MNIDDEFDEPPAITIEEYAQIKTLFARGLFEIELTGEDLVLNASCVPEFEDFSTAAGMVYSVSDVQTYGQLR